jgi:hypothetical protein
LPVAKRRWRGLDGGRGASAPGAGTAVAGQILAPAVSEEGRGWWLGQHGKVGDSFEGHRGGMAHRRGVLDGGGGSAEGCTGARPVAPVVRLVGTGASWWSLRTEWRHRMRTRGGR